MALTIPQFVIKYNFQSVDIDKVYGPQCWDLAEAYCREVLGIPANPFALVTGDGTAYGAFNIFPQHNPQFFNKVNRSHLGGLVNFTPKYGDLVFWNGHLPGSDGDGHVDICLADGARSGFTGFDQNWAGAYAHRVAHNYDWVVGYLRPKVSFR